MIVRQGRRCAASPAVSDRPRRRRPRSSTGAVFAGVVVLLLVLPPWGADRAGAAGRPLAPLGSAATAPAAAEPSASVGLAPSYRGELPPAGRATLLGWAPTPSAPLPPEWFTKIARPAASPAVGVPAPLANGTFSVTPVRSSQALVGTGFAGVTDTQCGCDPPDVQVAAGPTQVVELVNLYIEVWDTRGTAIAGQGLTSFFGTSNYLSDPRVIYDNLSGRFFVSILSIGSTVGYVYFAVSAGSNASGTWTVYRSIATPTGSFPDQPMMGLNATVLGFGGNVFSTSYLGAEWWVVNKSDVLRGATAHYVAFGPSPNDFSVHPAKSDQPLAPMFFVETFAGASGPIELFHVTGVPPGAVNISTENVSVDTIADPPPADTPGTAQIDTATARVAEAIWWQGRLYITFGDACTFGSASYACLRLDVLGVAGRPATLLEDFNIGLPGAALYYPSIALDHAGDLLVVFGVSSLTIFPSLAAAVQRAGDASGTISPFTWLAQGSIGRTASNCGTVCRFGDYFGAGMEPSGQRVWVAGEYLTPATSWQTWIAPVAAAPAPVASIQVPANVEVGATALVQITVTNAPCGAGLVYSCEIHLPLGNGVTYTRGCGALSGPIQAGAVYGTPGAVTVGTGGFVTIFPEASCTPGTEVGNLSLLPQGLTVVPGPSVVVSSSNAAAGDVGEPVTFTAIAQGGVGPYTAQWSQLPAGCAGTPGLQVSCTPTRAGSSNVTARVTDAMGGSATGAASYRVDPAPTVSLAADRSAVDANASLNLTGAASGGSGTFHYAWFGVPPGCLDLDAPTQSCAPTAAGTYLVHLEATDSRGVTSASPNLTLTVAPPLAVSVVASSSSVTSGSSVTFTARVTGGVTPFGYAWSGLPAGCTAGSAASITCTAGASDFVVRLEVRDAGGGSASATSAVTVAAGAALTGFAIELLVALAIVAAAAVGAAVVLVRRRRSRAVRPKEPDA
jgi:hypothetical protein